MDMFAYKNIVYPQTANHTVLKNHSTTRPKRPHLNPHYHAQENNRNFSCTLLQASFLCLFFCLLATDATTIQRKLYAILIYSVGAGFARTTSLGQQV